MNKMISIVTPVYNSEKYIERCIQSIKSQNYDNYEHIIVDGKSTDGTMKIIKKYVGAYPLKVISENDHGMYDAIAKGFKMANGEIFAWLNADDTYMPWAFQIMNDVITQGVHWCTGMNAWQNDKNVFSVSDVYFYNQKWIQKGYYNNQILRYIQQESTFWSKELFEKVNGYELISAYRYAGDFALWRAFARYQPLYSVNSMIGGFRVHTGQKSESADAYRSEMGLPEAPRLKKLLIRIAGKAFNKFPSAWKHKMKYICIKITK